MPLVSRAGSVYGQECTPIGQAGPTGVPEPEGTPPVRDVSLTLYMNEQATRQLRLPTGHNR